mmetsp:Transcript_22697/g.64365  ORF Transcript_22697/g.64365 Transcript_22697/m.64365 type:complete len:319 (-) Transcript_22697:25-981(-)
MGTSSQDDEETWQGLAAHLSDVDLAWLRAHWAAVRAEEEDEDQPVVPLHELFNECGTSVDSLRPLDAALASLNPPKRPCTVPAHFRTPANVSVHEVRQLRLATVRGSHRGHGDVLWGAGRYAAELLAEDAKGEALGRLLGGRGLEGLRVLELGAGLGLPSWVAARQGARVVTSDIRDPERLTALAVAASLNAADGAVPAQVRGHSWGEPCDELLAASGGGFDLVVLCDCLYITELHGELISSIQACLAPGGVVLVAFALHHEHNEEAVFGFFTMAASRGLEARAFEERQMPVRSTNMPDKRFYVYARTLTAAAASEGV